VGHASCAATLWIDGCHLVNVKQTERLCSSKNSCSVSTIFEVLKHKANTGEPSRRCELEPLGARGFGGGRQGAIQHIHVLRPAETRRCVLGIWAFWAYEYLLTVKQDTVKTSNRILFGLSC
jgi:hypothetical protein